MIFSTSRFTTCLSAFKWHKASSFSSHRLNVFILFVNMEGCWCCNLAFTSRSTSCFNCVSRVYIQQCLNPVVWMTWWMFISVNIVQSTQLYVYENKPILAQLFSQLFSRNIYIRKYVVKCITFICNIISIKIHKYAYIEINVS